MNSSDHTRGTPQSDRHHHSQYTTQVFRDFITPEWDAIVNINGTKQSLDSLHQALSPNVIARQFRQDPGSSPGTAFLIALNIMLTLAGLNLISEHELMQLLRMPWFVVLAKQSAKQHRVKNDLNLDNLISLTTISEDHMVVVLEAFVKAFQLDKIELGFVCIRKSVKAFHYPFTAPSNRPTAWIVADLRSNPTVYHGIGHMIMKNSVPAVDQDSDEEDEDHDESDGDQNVPSGPTNTPASALPVTTPRKTNPAVLAQQVPLPSNLSAGDILRDHKSRLQYMNILKVGLNFSNQEIMAACNDEALPNNEQINGCTAVVKRINTGIDWLEGQFGISGGALRTAYDRQRRDNNIPIRAKDEVDATVMATNAVQVTAAMGWIQTGGRRPPPPALTLSLPLVTMQSTICLLQPQLSTVPPLVMYLVLQPHLVTPLSVTPLLVMHLSVKALPFTPLLVTYLLAMPLPLPIPDIHAED
ncbi:hypothetical protein E4T42_01900 [Aureobasidium subglaciale]|nr:hypothetical protein E4T42_01900 [Aureobasidium subglaciale]